MHTRFQGSLLFVTGREGENPENEIAVVTRVGALSNYDDDDSIKKQLVLLAKQNGGRGHTTTNYPFSI